MEYAVTLATLAAVHIAWNLGPGPNVVLVAHVAARDSRRAGLQAALGLTVGASIWAAAAAIGLGVLSALESLQQVLRLAGAAYLVYLGVTLWWKAGRPGSGEATHAAPPGWRPFRRGVAANLANPISVIFFSSIFAAILPIDVPVAVRGAAVLIIALDALLWYAALAWVFSARPARHRYQRARRWIDGAAGTLMVGFGVRLALSAR